MCARRALGVLVFRVPTQSPAPPPPPPLLPLLPPLLLPLLHLSQGLTQTKTSRTCPGRKQPPPSTSQAALNLRSVRWLSAQARQGKPRQGKVRQAKAGTGCQTKTWPVQVASVIRIGSFCLMRWSAPVSFWCFLLRDCRCRSLQIEGSLPNSSNVKFRGTTSCSSSCCFRPEFAVLRLVF